MEIQWFASFSQLLRHGEEMPIDMEQRRNRAIA